MNTLFPALPFCVCMCALVHACGECVRMRVCAQYLLFPSHLAGGPPRDLLTVTARQVLWDPSPGLQGGGPVTRPRVPLKLWAPGGSWAQARPIRVPLEIFIQKRVHHLSGGPQGPRKLPPCQ